MTDAEQAAMYRWLRDQHWNDSRLAVVLDPKKNVMLGTICPFGDQLDELILEEMGKSRD